MEMPRGSIASTLAEARLAIAPVGSRASLKNPSRPYTPADHSRRLLTSCAPLLRGIDAIPSLEPVVRTLASRIAVAGVTCRCFANYADGPPACTPNLEGALNPLNGFGQPLRRASERSAIALSRCALPRSRLRGLVPRVTAQPI